MSKKYEFVEGDTLTLGTSTLIRIRAVRDIPWHGVKAGDRGGYIETEENLPHDDSSWVFEGSHVIGKYSSIVDSVVRGSVVERSVVRNSTLLHSTVRDSSIEDSRVWGSVILCGEIFNDQHHVLFSSVGSEKGRLTAYRAATGVRVTRGCFSGTLEEFESAVNEKHGDNQYGQEYRHLIAFIKERVSAWHKEGV